MAARGMLNGHTMPTAASSSCNRQPARAAPQAQQLVRNLDVQRLHTASHGFKSVDSSSCN